ncbi:MAG: serine O-acetyltransferase [Alphaproteobacteria bacterium CG_4_10_14_0_2_um_filter_63_37]|nr:MAG: serine O-acetyltransferase [Proteobacteria bacterium CG1_02_64_396]PJA25234.1 MAG: serine O-acetyltransferase [Alphaproteobacteria bacterium CG_4_10_14_0_2_um_filter_63_37]
MLESLRQLEKTVAERDPAARSLWEILTCYPGLQAIAIHRVAHGLWVRRWFWAGRFLSHIGRWLTGIEIHPGATIGKGFFIDHGMGVVIGETAEIGDNVTLYHGVTLGGTSWRKEKRHPTLQDNVVVGAGAKILGPVTIGEGSRIGANAVVVKDVPTHSSVVGIPGRIVAQRGSRLHPEIDLDHQDMPDPVARAIECLLEHLHVLDNKVRKLEGEGEEESAIADQALSCDNEIRQFLDDGFVDGAGI